jgi:hypothetical protein
LAIFVVRGNRDLDCIAAAALRSERISHGNARVWTTGDQCLGSLHVGSQLRDYSYSLAQESGIESRIASRGNRAAGGCQASKNVAPTRDDALAKLRSVSITATNNMVRQGSASCGNSGPLEALEHVVCLHFHPAAVLFKFFPASSRTSSSAFSLSDIVMNGRN